MTDQIIKYDTFVFIYICYFSFETVIHFFQLPRRWELCSFGLQLYCRIIVYISYKLHFKTPEKYINEIEMNIHSSRHSLQDTKTSYNLMWIIVILIISVGAVVLIEYRILWHLFKCSSAAHNNCSATDYIISETISITYFLIHC